MFERRTTLTLLCAVGDSSKISLPSLQAIESPLVHDRHGLVFEMGLYS